jgi:hypothetical protein
MPLFSTLKSALPLALLAAACVSPPDGGTPSGASVDAGRSADGGIPVVVPPDTAQPLSGTRLKAIYLQSSDGARHFTGYWHDAQRGEDCTFTAVDGVTYCLPPGATGNGLDWYPTSACTERVHPASADCAPAAYAWFYTGAACGEYGGLHVYATGPLQPATLLYFKDPSSGACRMPTNELAVPYQHLTEVPLSAFATATRFVDP